MSILPTWPIAAGTLVIGLVAGAYVDHNIMAGRIDKMTAAHAETLRQREVKRAADEATARSNERQMTEAIGLIEQGKTDEIARIRNAAADTVARLQNRPDRQPARTGGVPQAATACKGATGAELSRQDATVAVGIARDADEQREALKACYAAYDSIGR